MVLLFFGTTTGVGLYEKFYIFFLDTVVVVVLLLPMA